MKFGCVKTSLDQPRKVWIHQATKHANQWRTCLVQVPGQLHRGLRLHVVLEEALPERGLVVGLVRLGLDGRLYAGLGHLLRRSPDAAHGVVVVPPVRHRVRLPSLCAPLAAGRSADGHLPA